MAINAGTVLAYLDLDTGKFSNALQMAQSQMSSFAQDGGGMSSFIDGLGAGMTTVGRTLTMGVSVPLMGVGVAISKAAIGWESAFADIRKTVNITSGDTEAGFRRISDGLYAMSETIPVAKEGLAGIAANAGQLGVAEEYILSFTRVMADLEVATNLTGEEAAAMFAQYANITGMDMGQIENLGSTIVELGNNTATTERDIAEMMHRLAGAGSIVGLTDSQIAGLSATLTSLGINAEAGGSAMSRVLSEMDSAVIGNGKELKKFAQVAGISSKEFAAAWNADPISALQLFTKGLGAISAAGGDVNAALDAVGLSDIRITDMLKRLMGSGDLLTDTVAMANTAWEENNALANEAAQRYATVESKLTMLKNAVGNVATQFGNVLMPIISKGADLAMKAVQWVSGLSDGTKKLIVTAGGIAAAIGPALLVGGKLLSTFSGVIPIAGAIAGAIALVYNRSERLQGIVGKLKTDGLNAFNGLKAGVTAYHEALAGGASAMDAIAKGINTAFGTASGAKINGVMSKIISGFQTAGKIVRGTTDGVGEFIASLIDGQGVAASVEDALVAAFGGNVPPSVRAMQAAVGEFVSDLKRDFAEGGILGVLRGIGMRVGEAMSSAWEHAKTGVGSLRDKIMDGLALARERLEPMAKEWLSHLGEAYQNAKDYVTEKLPAVRDAIITGLIGTKNKIISGAKTAMKWLGDAYRSGTVQRALGSLSGVGELLMEKISAGKSYLTEKAGELLRGLGEALGSDNIKSRIGDLSSIAASIASKIASGVGAWKVTAAQLIGGLVTQLTDSGFLQTAFSGLGTIVTGIAEGLVTNAGNIITAGTPIITSLIKSLTSGGLIESIFSTGAQIVTRIASVIGSAAPNVISAATEIGSSLISGIIGLDWPKIFTTAGDVVTAIGDVIITAASGIGGAALQLMTELVKGMSTIDWSSLIGTVGTVARNLLDKVGEAIPGLTQGALDLMDAIITGIGSINWASVGTSLAGVATSLLTGIMDHLPETVEGIGKLVGKIGEGIGAAGAALGQAAGTLVSGLVTWVQAPENWQKIVDLGNTIALALVEGVATFADGVLGTELGFGDTIRKLFGLDTIIEHQRRVQEESAKAYENYQLASNKMLAMSMAFAEALKGQTTASFDDMAYIIRACALNMDYGLSETIPQIHQTAEELWNGLARSETIDQVKAIFAAQGYILTDAMAQSMLDGKEEVLTVANAIGMSLDDVLKGSIAETEVTLKKSATEWGRIFGQAIPDGATVGLENGMYVLRSKTGEVIQLVSAVDAKADVEAGNKDTAKAGVDAMSGELETGEATVSEAAQGVADSVTSTLEPLPGLMQNVGKDGVTGIATGGLSAKDEVTTAMLAISTEAVDTALKTMSVKQGNTIGSAFVLAMSTGTKSMQGLLTSGLRTIGSQALNAISSILSSSAGSAIGRTMIQSVINGATSMGGALNSAMRGIANAAVSAFRSALQMHSPSTILIGDGMMMVRSVAIGADKSTGEVIGNMVRLAESVHDVWDGIRLDPLNMTDKPYTGRALNADVEGGFTLNFYGDITVREEADIHRISAELYNQFRDDLRGRGY